MVNPNGAFRGQDDKIHPFCLISSACRKLHATLKFKSGVERLRVAALACLSVYRQCSRLLRQGFNIILGAIYPTENIVKNDCIT
jgi:hypothetical protein